MEKAIPGKIVIGIDRKIYFEPDGLEKPDKKTYDKAKIYNFENLIIQKYEASKQLIEVSNKNYEVANTSNGYWMLINREHKIIFDGQTCKAEITGDKAEIIELTKE